MAKIKLKMMDLDEANTHKGTSFMLYGPSGSRKTRTLGSMSESSVTLHLSLDYGSNSATDSMRTLGIKGAVHKVANVASMEEFGQWLIELHTNNQYKANIDNIVVDDLVTIHSKVSAFVANLPRYKSDRLMASDVLEDNVDKKAESKKSLPMHMDIQTMVRDLMHQLMSLKDSYNIIVLAGDVLLSDPTLVPVPTVYPLVAGPKSIRPVTSIFDNVLSTSFKEGDLDTEDHVATYFNLSTFTDPMTGVAYFNKTRSVTNTQYLKDNKIPADFRILLNEQVGYVNKKDRKKETK